LTEAKKVKTDPGPRNPHHAPRTTHPGPRTPHPGTREPAPRTPELGTRTSRPAHCQIFCQQLTDWHSF